MSTQTRPHPGHHSPAPAPRKPAAVACEPPDGAAGRTSGGPGARGAPSADPRAGRTLSERVEAWLSRLSTRNNFWHRACSLVWLPYAFRSGIRMKRLDANTFSAILPFKRINRNWYNAMAGAALLGNAEIAGGMYVFGYCGGEYTVVCKHLDYKFLRPCLGPAVYRVVPKDDIEAMVAAGGEFNVTMAMNVVQQIRRPGEKEKRVGRVNAVFHVTPKLHHKEKAARRDTAVTAAPRPGDAGDADDVSAS